MSKKNLDKAPSRKMTSSSVGQRDVTQYDLFCSFFPSTGNTADDYSNTIELWDATPKYSVSARKQVSLRDDKGKLEPLPIEFQYNPKGYQNPIPCRLEIHPANIEVKPSVWKQFFPSADEELVEEVLRKIFTDQRYGAHFPAERESRVRFTIRTIQRELQARGKTRSIPEIHRSILILSRVHLVLEIKGNKTAIYNNSILTNVTTIRRNSYLNDPTALWQADLPALISIAINNLIYRQFNYSTLMALDNALQRWLFKRLSHYYTYASITKPYSFSFSFFERNSALLNHSRAERNRKSVETVLDALTNPRQVLAGTCQKSRQVLMSWKQEPVYTKSGKRIVDIIYTLWPSAEFVADIKAANARLRDDLNKLGMASNTLVSPFLEAGQWALKDQTKK